MGINRKELEEKTFQWFNSSISDKDYNSLSMSYLAHRNYRLYKYQSPLASLDTLSRFFEHLKTNTLSLSAPSVFNDPFDCQFSYPPAFGEETFGEVYTLIDSVFRIGSLTEQPDNLLMWAHYAGAYRGVCIEYDLSNFSEEHTKCYLIPVSYQTARPSLPKKLLTPSHQEPTDEDLKKLSEALFIKSECWQYEFEWRLLKAIDGESANSKYLKFEMPPIKKVYLGARFRNSITESNWIYDTLCEICKAKDIEIIETHLNTELYKVDIPT